MSAALHLGGPEDLPVLLPLIASFHEHCGIASTQDGRQDALGPLLQGSSHGMVYLIGPRRAPVGYIAVSIGYSIEFGGLDACVDEFYIRTNVRGRGVGSEVLASLLPVLAQNGVKALHLETKNGNRAAHLFSRAGFRTRDGYHLMTKTF